MIYLDNAATSYPKPEQTVQLLNHFVVDVGGNPGRSGHTLSLEAARIIFDTREKLTNFIHAESSERLIFTQNGTESLNLAILGLLKEKDHVVTSPLEHNSVMRPLMFLRKEKGIRVSIAPASSEGVMDIKRLKRLVRKDTKAVIVNHASNVTGTIQSLEEIREAISDVILIVDACQTVGTLPINVLKTGIDILCFSGHKSLFGVQGTGALYFREGVELKPLKFGGTGSNSESLEHPSILPDTYECGTPNTPGIAALLGGLQFIETIGLENLAKRKNELRIMLMQELSRIKGLIRYGNYTTDQAVPVISINLLGKLPSEVGYTLNKNGIFVRVGLHCAPMAHKAIGTFPTGTVRISPGYFTTDDNIHKLLGVLSYISR